MALPPQPLRIRDKMFVPRFLPEQIEVRVRELAAQISADYQGRVPILVPVLNGSFVFVADLVRQLDIPFHISFIKVASYEQTASTGKVEKVLGLSESIAGEHVLLIEDIVDTGLTMAEVVTSLRALQPASIQIVTLLAKPDSIQQEIPLAYTGFEIGPEFVIGYGMDYDGLGRGLPWIGVVEA